MDCREANRYIYGLLDGEAPPEAREALDAHLASCPSCAAEHAAVRRALEPARDMQVPDPGEDYWSSFLPRLRGRIEAREKERSFVFLPAFRVLAAVSATALLLVAVIAFFEHRRPATPPPPAEAGYWAELDGRLDEIRSDEDLQALQAFVDPDAVDVADGDFDVDFTVPEDSFPYGDLDVQDPDLEAGFEALTPAEQRSLIASLKKDLG